MITRQEIIKRARSRGICGINEVYCRRLEPKGRGLIPKAKIEYPGRGGDRSGGAIARYPDGIDELVMKIAQLHQNHFSYDGQIPLALWNMGYEINVLPLFEKSLKEYKTFAKQLANLLANLHESDDDSNQLDADIFNKIAQERLSKFDPQFRKMIGQIRKWVGKKNMPTTIAILSWAITGHPGTTSVNNVVDMEGDEEHDRHAFVSPIVRALQGIATIPSIKELIDNIQGYLDPDNLDEVLHQITDKDSVQDYLCQGYHEMSNAIVFVSGITGWKISIPKLPAKFQCIFTLIWLSFRQDPKLLEGYNELMKTANKLSPENILYQETPPAMTATILERVYGLPPNFQLGISTSRK